MNSSIAPAGGEARRQGRLRRRLLRPHVRSPRAAGEVLRRASGVLLAGQRQAAEEIVRSSAAPIPDVIRLCTEGIRRAMRPSPRRPSSPSRRTTGTTTASAPAARRWPSARTRRSPRCCNWSTAWPRRWKRSFPTRPSRRWPTSGPASRRNDAAAAERHRAALLDRVLLLASAGHLRQPGQSGVSRRPGGLGARSPSGFGSGTTRPISRTTCCRFPTSGSAARTSASSSPTTSRASSSRTPTTRRTANWPALGGYLTAKFLWNPDYDENRAIDEFLDGYYGKAAAPIRDVPRPAPRPRRAEEHPREDLGRLDSPHLTDELL